MQKILIDSGILLSDYRADEPLHTAVLAWCDRTMAELVTSPICIAETLWLLGDPGECWRHRTISFALRPVAASPPPPSNRATSPISALWCSPNG